MVPSCVSLGIYLLGRLSKVLAWNKVDVNAMNTVDAPSHLNAMNTVDAPAPHLNAMNTIGVPYFM